MKIIKNNILKSFLVLGVLALSSLLFVACGKTHLKLEEDVKAQMFAKEAYLLENVYKKEETLDFNSSQSANFITNSNYFVKVATKVEEEVKNIKLGHVVYSKNDTAQTKVSSVNTLTRKAFYVEEGALYISNILMFLNTSNNGILTLSFPNNNFMKLDIKVYETAENELNLKVVQMTEQSLQEIDKTNLKYKFEIDNPNGKVFFELSKADDPLESSDTILLQTVANPEKNNQTYASKFETPATVEQATNSGIEVSPGYNQGQPYTQSIPANHILVYNVYVPDIGVKTVMIEFKNTKTS